MLVYLARHLLPVTGPPVRDGAVAVRDGRIVHCGTRSEVLEAAGDAPLRDLGNVAVLPGMVNAHTHLELSWMGLDPPPGGDYVEWIGELLVRREGENLEEAVRQAEAAVARIVARGTVAVGDVGNQGWIASVIARSDLLGICFQEIYGFRRADAERRIEEALRQLTATAGQDDVRRAADRLRIVLTPHAPHTTSRPLLRALAGRAVAADEPLSIHVAESAAEGSLVRGGKGPFVDLLRRRGMWDEDWAPTGQGPVEYLDRLELLTPRTLAVHCVHLEGGDPARLQARGVTVVTCPRSNRYLGVGTAPVPRLLGAGIPVALGTDSMASSADLDLFAEIAALRSEHPRISPAAALRMATFNGAVALGLGDRLGSIEPGKLARLVVVPVPPQDDDPLDAVCSCPAEVHPLDGAPWEPAA